MLIDAMLIILLIVTVCEYIRIQYQFVQRMKKLEEDILKYLKAKAMQESGKVATVEEGWKALEEEDGV